jgi:hypothetical protein
LACGCRRKPLFPRSTVNGETRERPGHPLGEIVSFDVETAAGTGIATMASTDAREWAIVAIDWSANTIGDAAFD